MTSSRIVIVTGASAGIGLATAQLLVKAGHRVVINARRADRLEAIAKELGAHHVAIAPGDCADQGVIDLMLDVAVKKFGREADGVVVNAGRGLNGSVLSSDPAQWDEVVRTNVIGAARLIRSAAARMTAQVPASECHQHGAWLKAARDIVVIGSVVGRHVSPFSSMYGGTKFAVHGMTEGVRRELAPKGVRVTLIEPGFVVSEFQGVAGYADAWFDSMKEKMAPMLEPADVARMIDFVLQQPPHVHVSDIMVRPTRQEYP